MKYYGDKELIRVKRIKSISLIYWIFDDTAIAFIKKKGLFEKYVEEMANKRGTVTTIDLSDFTSVTTYEYNGRQYVYGSRGKDELGDVEIYEIMPRLYNEDEFVWRKNKKYDRMECVIAEDIFEFSCVTKDNDTVSIDIRYTACDNRHRNKVTIANIEVFNATNENIRKAIRQWKKSFKETMQYI